MIYLLSLLFILQSIFYWLIRPPTMILDAMLELKYVGIFCILFFGWIISGKST